MPCDTRIPAGMTAAQRAEQIRKTLERLDGELASGSVKLKVGPSGAVYFEGWNEADRNGVNDACAFRALQQSNSFALRRAMATCEAGGRKINLNAINSGVHSHDGGHTWHPGH